jgi:Predicted membrane protein
MNQRFSRAVRLGRAILTEARAEKITFLAGSLAYHAFISLLPLLVLLLVAITTLGTESMEAGFLALVRSLVSPGGRDVALAELFIAELRAASQSTGLSVVGGAVLLWGTMRIFRGVDTAFSAVYETEAANTFLDQLRDAVVVLVAFGVAVVVAGVLQRLLPPGTALSRIALAGTLALTLYPMYYVFPDTDVTAVEVVPGTLFAAIGLTLLESLFRFYLTLGGSESQPTVISGVLVLLTWLYFASLVLLLGVVVNAVLSNRSRDIHVVPVFGDNMPTQAGTSDERSVAERLRRLEHLFATESLVTITAGDETVTLPAPLSVEIDTDADGFVFDGSLFGLTLQWAANGHAENDVTEETASEEDDSEPRDS